jgi:hypothetical protein
MKTTSYDENVFNAKKTFSDKRFRVETITIETLKIQDGGLKSK